MKIAKVKYQGQWTFNTYEVEVSYSQLMAIKNALAADHANPVADELFAELKFYLDNLPGPGEDPDSLKKAEEAATSGMDTETGESPLKPQMAKADDLLPEPPGEEGGEELGDEPGGAEFGEEPGGEAEGPGRPAPRGGGEEESEADRRIPVPEPA